MDFKPYIDGVNATGFPFEQNTAEKLRRQGWQIIANRYYIDDDENKPREIDLLAYKAASFKDFDLRTAIIISCKKSDQHHWAFLSRDANLKDPNSDWQPVHFWSNDKPLSHVLSKSSWPAEYHDNAEEFGVEQILVAPEYDVFAFQELYCGEPRGDKKVGTSRGDSFIYASIMSTVKAQLYEMSIRPSSPRKKPIVYQFNLLSLADTKFLRLHFRGDAILPAEIDCATHIARYIVKRQQIFARVLFSTKEYFETLLQDFDRLHEANKKILTKKRTEFYTGIEKDKDKLRVLVEDFRSVLYRNMLFSQNAPPLNQLNAIKEVNLDWDDEKSRLKLCVSSFEVDLEILNKLELRASVKSALKQIYRYEGDFIFDDDIPF
jgi:hypothetical protein